MKKNFVKTLAAVCGLLCAQTGWSAGELPSKVVFSPKTPVRLSIRIETTEKGADSCKKVLSFYMVEYKAAQKFPKADSPWVVEVSKEYTPPLDEADKIIKTLRGTPCGASGDFTWTVSQEATFHESAKPNKPAK